MMDEDNKNEMVEQYLLGELSGELLEEFKEKLASDEKLRKEVALERAIVKNLKTVGREEWALKLESLHQEMDFTGTEIPLVYQPDADKEEIGIQSESFYQDNNQKVWVEEKEAYPKVASGKQIKWNTSRYVWMAAASVALLIVCTLAWLNLSNYQTDANTIFEAYYAPYPEASVFRGSAETTALESEAFAAYNQEKFNRSIELFNQILATQPKEEVLFYLGNAYLATNKYPQAIQTFENYLKTYQERKIDVQWYLSLTYLKVGKEEEAKTLLNELAATTASDAVTKDYRNKAIEILDTYK